MGMFSYQFNNKALNMLRIVRSYLFFVLSDYCQVDSLTVSVSENRKKKKGVKVGNFVVILCHLRFLNILREVTCMCREVETTCW